MLIQGAPEVGLCGQQAKPRAAIFLKDELRERRTQDAIAVENDDGDGRRRSAGLPDRCDNRKAARCI